MLKIAVFGAGHLGKFHLNNWKEIEGVELVGFYDPSDRIAKSVAEKYSLKRFINPEELMALCDAADIVAPTPDHFHLCQMAVRLGKHVFVEKPMCNTMEEANELVKLVREANVKLQVGHVERFNPAFLAVKDLELNPMFIEVHRLSQFNPRGTEVSVILDLMIHDIDIILKLVKSDVKNVYANGVAVMTDTPDIANVRIEFERGGGKKYPRNGNNIKKMGNIGFFQRDGYIGIDFLEKKAEIIKMKTNDDKEEFSFDIDTRDGKKTIAISNPPVIEVNAIKMELEQFRDAIVNNKPVPVSEVDGLRAMDVAHQILQKIQRTALA